MHRYSSSRHGEPPASTQKIRPSLMYQGLKMCYGIPPGYTPFSSRLIQLFGRVTRLVYQRALTKTSDFPATYGLLDDLKKWRSDLPDYLHPNCPTAPSFVRAINYLNLRYNHIVMLLTRQYLLHPLMDNGVYGGEWTDLARVCEDANDESISLIKEAFRKNVLGKTNYLDVYYIIADSMILFLRVLKSPSEQLIAKLGEVLPLIAMTKHIHFGKFGFRSLSALYGRLKSLHDGYDNLGSVVDRLMINFPGSLQIFGIRKIQVLQFRTWMNYSTTFGTRRGWWAGTTTRS